MQNPPARTQTRAAGAAAAEAAEVDADREHAEQAQQREVVERREEELAGRRRPAMPVVALTTALERASDWGSTLGGQWTALDDVGVWACAVAAVPVVAEVPAAVRGRWQRAWVDVYDEVYLAATTQGTDHRTNMTRALKWFLVLPQILLRGPKKGVKCLHSNHTIRDIKSGFDKWESGQRRRLVNDWLQKRRDTERKRKGRMTAEAAQVDEAEKAKREADMAKLLAMEALEDGQMQRSMNMLTSPGVAGITCLRHDHSACQCDGCNRTVDGCSACQVRDYSACQCEGCTNMQQLQHRHPKRRPASLPLPAEFGVGRQIKLNCRERMLGLKRQKAAGVTGTREDHLRALAQRSGDGCEKAKRAVSVVDALGMEYMAGRLPKWFYHVFTTVRCVPLSKPAGGVRPLGIGECMRKLWWAEVTKETVADFKAAVYPRQVAVGVRAAGQTLALTITF